DVTQLLSEVNADPNVADFEVDDIVTSPEATPRVIIGTTPTIPLAPSLTLTPSFDVTGVVDGVNSDFTLDQSTAGILDSVAGATVLNYFGTQVPSFYVDQTATSLIRLTDAQNQFSAFGSGTVAIIDTGVDPNHAALQPVLLPGFDFTRDQEGANELLDLDQSTAGILDQSTAGILDQTAVLTLNQSTAGILDQSTAGILDSSKLPRDFGHGTMVAGVVHLVAPQAHILPLKAFDGHGIGHIYDVVNAIFYAVDVGGANVINMSFDYGHAQSPMLKLALWYANMRGAICVAAAGNGDSSMAVFPAGYGMTFGVASTSTDPVPDLQSGFSNYGSWVDMAAPGEAIRTTYPGNHYAAAWGTSFSTPFVSGTVALLHQFADPLTKDSVAAALSKAAWINPNLGWGRLDVYRAVATYASH
ncbi:MAG TPA: S8 family serine peptidase, partial [Terriglobales bacterium]|nr:S8 family serine peptidase [Terriglobales bacterium]